MSQSLSNGAVLIGPEGVGKTMLGKRLAKHLGLPFHDLGDDKQEYRGSDYPSRKKLAQIYTEKGYGAVIKYMMPYRAALVGRALTAYGKSVVELGALYSIYEGADLLRRVRNTMDSYDQVVLMLPSREPQESLELLASENKIMYRGQEWYEYLARHPSNQRLAKQMVYSVGKSPEETCQEIIERLDPGSPTIILMGPVGAGKTTIGKLLADRLAITQIPMDGIRYTYYEEVGYREREEKRIAAGQGFSGVLDYWKKFDAHAVKRVLEDHSSCVIDFGAGHSVFDDEGDFRRVEKLLRPFPNVFLLMPSPDMDEAMAVLRERMEERTRIDGKSLNLYILTHPSNQKLSTMKVYTAGTTVEELIGRIIQYSESSGRED